MALRASPEWPDDFHRLARFTDRAKIELTHADSLRIRKALTTNVQTNMGASQASALPYRPSYPPRESPRPIYRLRRCVRIRTKVAPATMSGNEAKMPMCRRWMLVDGPVAVTKPTHPSQNRIMPNSFMGCPPWLVGQRTHSIRPSNRPARPTLRTAYLARARRLAGS